MGICWEVKESEMALADDDRVMQYRDFAMTSLAIEAFPSAPAPTGAESAS